ELATLGAGSLRVLKGRRVAYELGPLNEVDFDIAALALSAEAAPDLRRRYTFTTLTDLGNLRNLTSQSRFLVAGYPASTNPVRMSRNLKLRARPVSYVSSNLVHLADISSQAKAPLVHFGVGVSRERLLDFANVPVAFTKPYGMSGGGIWRLEIEPVSDLVET